MIKIVLKHLSGSNTGLRRKFSTFPILIGRDADSDLEFHVQKDIEVSGRHFEIVQTEVGFEVRDLGSTNGTWVNGKRVDRQSLRSGDIIELGLGGPSLQFRQPRGFFGSLLALGKRRKK